MASTINQAKHPAPFDSPREFISPAITNVLHDPIYQQGGIKFLTWKSFAPLTAFDVSTRPQKTFDFRLFEATGFLVSNSEYLSCRPINKSLVHK